MKRQDYLFQQPIKVAGETIKGIALSTQEIAHLQTLPAGKSASIGFVLDGSPSFVSRTCHIIKCEQPERTDESISENCLKFFFYYWKDEKIFACAKINFTVVSIPSVKNDMFVADSIQQLEVKSEESKNKQKAAVLAEAGQLPYFSASDS